MKKIFLILFIFFIAFSLFLPSPSFAAEPLVPCGGDGQEACNLCHAFELTNNVFNFITHIIVPSLLVIMVIWGGVTLLTSGGNQENVKKGRKILTSAVIGAIIVYTAFLIVGTILGIIVSNDNVGGFFKFQNAGIVIECPVN